MAKINKKRVLKKLNNPRSVNKIRGEVVKQSRLIFYPAKNELLLAIDNDKISQEIKAGEHATNITGTLDGKGNLFSFIGFSKGSEPVRDLVRLINSKLRPPSVRKIQRKDTLTFEVSFPAPTQDEIESDPITSIANYTSESTYTSRSWVNAIRRGLAGYGSYLYKKTEPHHKKDIKDFKNTRSGTAIQVPNKLRSGSFKPMSYLGPHLLKFRSHLRKGKL